jgi:signal transduction histidine kinase/DNA-binding response OmpR family regulator/CHASE3 domain sensor protein
MIGKPETFATRKPNTDPLVWLGLAIAILFFLISGALAYLNVKTLKDDNQLVVHTHQAMIALEELLSTLKDAETGQRGFLLTADESYLGPYNAAVQDTAARLAQVKDLTIDNPRQQERLRTLKVHVDAKLAELKQTIDLRHQQGAAAALAVVQTNRGKEEMDAIRAQVSAMAEEEIGLREQRLVEMADAYQKAIVSGALSSLLGLALTGVVGFLIFRADSARRRQDWLQSGRAGLAQAMLGDQPTDQLGDNILSHLCGYLDAQAGAVFIRDRDSAYRRVSTYGVPPAADIPTRFVRGESLLGQVAVESRSFLIQDVPDGYLAFGSALGQGKPKELILTPGTADGLTNAVIELGFHHPLNPDALTLLDQMSEAIGVAVRSANYRVELQNLLEETQRQAEELQAQGEELRVSNEELEEQSRALRESQSRLEQQQAELEQTNTQLEEQASQLETQRDDLERANEVVQLKAQELEQASRYKSDFLANMSHELRTPLNSLLILAKLLADNSEDTLTEEQIRYAQTIQSSGNDLLTLINDILDLSKIEAGHMEIKPEPLELTRLAKDLSDLFSPLAEKKDLEFRIEIGPECPPAIETDGQRLEQVLRNLLSNAVKFTEKGKVELTIQRAPNAQVAFSVLDTGIGIPDEHQKAVFEPFRQADGTISRKYGGTGLGLSISRELVRLLGGVVTLRSAEGQGSTFVVTIPEVYSPSRVQPRTEALPTTESISIAPPGATVPAPETDRVAPPRRSVEDDRDQLTGGKRVLLVIEDDESFARILKDLSHEMEFECLIAGNAVEALSMAKEFLPNAVVLDLGLPDHSGLWVLDQLKRDIRTRHVPVHVISATDNAETALSLGAIGYLLKPVNRDELAEVLKRLETRLEQRVRRVLIVEDDAVQREAVRKLLGSHDVEAVAAATASECLEQLRDQIFDCMVLDLSLPDASGYSLLETLSREDAYSFPPVIVYTGRELSSEEEQRLRRYSKSIIIKGAKSPERLLDEVSLFLHQVVSELPDEQQSMIRKARNRDALLEGKRILVVEDDVRNIYSLTSIFEPRGALVQIARNGREAIEELEKSDNANLAVDLVLMDVMMPVMDGLAATRQIRQNPDWKKLPIIMLTAKAMQGDQARCLEAGASDYMAKPLDVEKLLSLVRVWMPR